MCGSIHIQVPYPVPSTRKTKCLGLCISKFPILYRAIEKLNVWVNTYLSSPPPTEQQKNSTCGSMHIQVPHPVPSNRKTKCLGLCISKFPIPYRKIEKLNVWVTLYPSSPSPYRTIEKLNVWVYAYPSFPSPYRTIEKLNVWVNIYPSFSAPTEQ
jgi:hypothetical protein